MRVDFDKLFDRKASNSLKWSYPSMFLSPQHAAADPLPMWVADMDFEAPEPVRQALREAVEFGVYGYGGTPDHYREAVVSWQKRRFGWTPPFDSLVLTPGIVTALNMIIQTFTAPGDSVLVQTPVYGHFHQDVIANGRHVAYAPLTLENGRYYFDARTFEAAIRQDTKLFILCNPQNPTGNVWSREDLIAMGEICLKHGILVVSDEIHGDLVLNPALRHIPFASLNEAFAANSFVCTAPSKTFNLAGLQCSNLFVANPRLRIDLQRHLARCGLNLINILGLVACEAAYRECEPWLKAVLEQLRGNQTHFARAVNTSIPQIKVLPMDSLYLAWMDCRQLGLDPEALNEAMLTRARLWLDDGRKFGPPGEGFMRINLACSRVIVDDAIRRLQTAFAQT